MVTGRAVFCSSKKRQIQSVVFLTVLYRTAEWDVPGKGFHAAVDKLAVLAGASSFVHVLLWRFHHQPVGLWHGWDQWFSKCGEHLPGGGARELPGRPFMKTRYSRNYHLGGPRIRMDSCLVNRPKVRRGRKESVPLSQCVICNEVLVNDCENLQTQECWWIQSPMFGGQARWVFYLNSFYKSYRVNKYAKHKATQASPRQVCTCVCFENMSSRLFSPPSSLRLFNDPVLFALFSYVPTYFGDCRI